MLNPSPNQQLPPNLSASQIPKTAILDPPMPKHRATPIVIPKTLPPTEAATTTAVERRLAPSTGLTASMLQDYSDDEIDAELRHLGILFYGTTRRFEKNKMMLEHYNNVIDFAQRVQLEQQDIFEQIRANNKRYQ